MPGNETLFQALCGVLVLQHVSLSIISEATATRLPKAPVIAIYAPQHSNQTRTANKSSAKFENKLKIIHLLEDTILCLTPLHDADDNPRLIMQMINLFLRQSL